MPEAQRRDPYTALLHDCGGNRLDSRRSAVLAWQSLGESKIAPITYKKARPDMVGP